MDRLTGTYIREMSKEDIIKALKPYFALHELVCPHIYAKYGEFAWNFLQKEILALLLWGRVGSGIRMNINTYGFNNPGARRESGLRCNICKIPKTKTLRGDIYVSSHCVGGGLDIDPIGVSANELRVWFIENQDTAPYKFRLEDERDADTWCHIDTYTYNQKTKVYIFRA